MYPLIAYNKIDICFANLFDGLVLLRLHFIIIISFQTTFLQKPALGKPVGMAQQSDILGEQDKSRRQLLIKGIIEKIGFRHPICYELHDLCKYCKGSKL